MYFAPLYLTIRLLLLLLGRVRPKPSSGENVLIHLGMELYQVIDLSEKTEVY